MVPMGIADLHFRSPQPDASLYCETMDMELVHRVMCLFTSQPKLVLIYRPGGMEGWVSLIVWFHTEMVYSLVDGHLSQY